MTSFKTRIRPVALGLLALFLCDCESIQTTEGPIGAGTADEPYRIATSEDLQWLSETRSVWGANFVQVDDIDASESRNWHSGAGMAPIGNDSMPFHGRFNGQGHAVTGLIIHRSSQSAVGMFGVTAAEATIDSVRLLHLQLEGGYRTGGLVGSNDGVVRHCQASGEVVGLSSTGGLVGLNTGSILSSAAFVAVRGRDLYAGGLVGTSEGEIRSCRAEGPVTGSWGVGGLAGQFQGAASIILSTASGPVQGEGTVGGLVGIVTGGSRDTAILLCHATGEVVGGSCAGGLVGFNSYGKIAFSYATGDVSGLDVVGGLVGRNENASILSSYASGRVTGRMRASNPPPTSPHGFGGLIGSNFGFHSPLDSHLELSRVYATGDVAGDSVVGGLVGQNLGRVREAFATGAVRKALGGDAIGGLIGSLDPWVRSNLDTVEGHQYPEIESSCWNIQSTGAGAPVGGGYPAPGARGLTDEAMGSAVSFAGWDFDKTWALDPGSRTPWLQRLGITRLPGTEP